jgi:hypothetical protein
MICADDPNSLRKLRTSMFWRSWSLCEMPGIRLVITINAFLGLENPSSGTSCSGLRTPGTKTCFG